MNIIIVYRIGELEFTVASTKKRRQLIFFCTVKMSPIEIRFNVLHERKLVEILNDKISSIKIDYKMKTFNCLIHFYFHKIDR